MRHPLAHHVHLEPVSLPVGAITAFAGPLYDPSASTPASPLPLYPPAAGWLVCDGSSLNRNDYPELFSALGYLYGGSGNTFLLPDLRGMFLRGVSKPDDDAALEDRSPASGGDEKDVGSVQQFAVQTHVHTYTAPGDPAPVAAGSQVANVVQTVTPATRTSTPADGKGDVPGEVKVSQYETRPVNIFVHYLIKYTSRLPGYHFPCEVRM